MSNEKLTLLISVAASAAAQQVQMGRGSDYACQVVFDLGMIPDNKLPKTKEGLRNAAADWIDYNFNEGPRPAWSK